MIALFPYPTLSHPRLLSSDWTMFGQMVFLGHRGLWKIAMWLGTAPNQKRYIGFLSGRKKADSGLSWCENAPKLLFLWVELPLTEKIHQHKIINSIPMPHVHQPRENKVFCYLTLSSEDDAGVSEDIFSKQTADTKRLQWNIYMRR